MKTSNLTRIFATVAILSGWQSNVHCAEPLDFNRDIRPILSEACYHCHGFSEQNRAADLRLDTFAGATADLGGHTAIVPGRPDSSELVTRIYSSDEDLLMPPKDSRRVLSDAQKEVLRRWIEQGARYEKHWSFQPPTRSETAASQTIDESIRHSFGAIDAFVQTRLAEKQWSLSPPAAPEKWLRRVWFDLAGIAPPPEKVDAFVKDFAKHEEPAFAAAVDELLQSPRFGERMAQDWMDAARYADTHGFNNDSQRSMWRWRDWVIQAFNQNLPYDQFLTKQLAGDLLPNPTLDDLIATGYCRNHVINSEGGIIGEEYRVEYVIDRVRTLGTSVLGLTLECARCHDHKFDPISQKDFYRLYAFFNQVSEVGEDGRVANAFPMIAAPTVAEQTSLAELDLKIENMSVRMQEIVADVERKRGDHEPPIASIPLLNGPLKTVPWFQNGDHPFKLNGQFRIEETAFGQSYAARDNSSTIEWELPKPVSDHGKRWTFTMWVRWNGERTVLASSMRFSVDRSASSYGGGLGIEINAHGEVEVKLGNRWPAYSAHVISEAAVAKDEWTQLVITHEETTAAAGISIFVNGELSRALVKSDGAARGAIAASGGRLRLGSHGSDEMPTSLAMFASPKLLPVVVADSDIRESADILFMQHLAKLPKRTSKQDQTLLTLHLTNSESPLFNSEYSELRSNRQSLERQRQGLMRSVATTMVMQDQSMRRDTFVLTRGQYNAPGEHVEPGVPEELLAAWPENAPKNRLGLAAWLTQPEHPLTARVAVNRFWQHLFGIGLVKSSEDFGLQGEYPSHPELLDWLARDFVASGWDVKRMMKQLVLSKTYRQDSRFSDSARAIDPENRWLARGPRFRLPAENVRDHLLDVGGLLRHRDGGPSVYPKQPSDLYEGIVVDAPYPGTKWLESEGDDLYRRSVYTFWKRTVPFPLLTVFDAPDREVCTAKRLKTNTPLQALALMNEPSLFDAARGLANRMRQVSEEAGTEDVRERIAYGFRLATGRLALNTELDELVKLADQLRRDYVDEPDQALLMLGENNELATEAPELIAERAAMVAVGSVILNLDETITKD